MNKKNTTRILQTQIIKIDNLHHSKHRLWLDQTKTYIISFFSKDSYEYNYLKHFTFESLSAIPISSSEKEKTIDDFKNEIKKFLK